MDLETAVYVVCLDYSRDLVNVYNAYMREERPELAQIALNAHKECVRMLISLRLGYLSSRECLEMVQAERKNAIDEIGTAFADSTPGND